MLYALRSNIYYVRAKIRLLNAWSKVRPKGKQHASGYEAGSSPGTDRLPIIDKSLHVTRIAPRKEAHAEGLLHPTVHLLIFSPDKRYVLIQARSSKKDFSGGKLGPPVGGHVVGDQKMVEQTLGMQTMEETLAKEAFEEAGLKGLTFQFVKRFPYRSQPVSGDPTKHKNQEIVSLFSADHAGKIYPNLSEVSWMGWFSLAGLQKFAKKRPNMFTGSLLTDLKCF